MDNTSRPRSDNDSLNRRLIRHQIKSSALKETPAPEKYVEPSAADQNESFDTASVLRQVLMPSIEKNSGNVDSADIMLDEISEDENFRRLSEGYKAETTIEQMEDSMAEQRRLYFEEQRKLRKHADQN
mmetsp:Transcript_31618/g.44896  ORF Transcript_31618/g.44896 Transcript_31618/m.44896 type:complete len:128 (-) Transcript_31618:200-583(-)